MIMDGQWIVFHALVSSLKEYTRIKEVLQVPSGTLEQANQFYG
jgi:hypothetical protein